MAATPFQISVPSNELDLLLQKLELTRFPDEIEGAGWDYGSPLADIKRLVEHWKAGLRGLDGGFDWRKEEARLNAELPQFTRDIEVEGHGVLNVHYVHQKSDVKGAIPLIFVHGWPGSFIEVRKILPLLVEASPDHPSFHVVALSLPGFGFSEAPKKPGFEVAQMAETCHKLMLALGYAEYVAQGGDWGSHICREIAKTYGPSGHAKAWHTNMPLTSPPTLFSRPFLYLYHLLFGYTAHEKANLARWDHFFDKGFGYNKLQSTQPQTIGYSLADSPVGLLGWIYEKLHAWSDEYGWTDDEVLTWVSIYWFSRAGPAASTRIYYETAKKKGEMGLAKNVETPIPTGHSYFPKEIHPLPPGWYRPGFPNLVFEATHDKGGHFAAYEVPHLLVGDLRKMFGKGGPAFKVVPGKTGYT